MNQRSDDLESASGSMKVASNHVDGVTQSINKENQENVPDELVVEQIVDLFENDNKVESNASSAADNISSNAAALYDELDSFRQKWKRELEGNKNYSQSTNIFVDQASTSKSLLTSGENDAQSLNSNSNAILRESFLATNSPQDNPKKAYALARKLFLIGVGLEQDEMHHESIRYYKQAVHLCPDIERQIFREQCVASVKIKTAEDSNLISTKNSSTDIEKNDSEDQVPLLNRIRESYCDGSDNEFNYCKPAHKIKSNTLHISKLPHELVLQICRYVVGQELDLASLETMGMVCRGFYLLSRDQSIWRNICQTTWGEDILTDIDLHDQGIKVNGMEHFIDWRQIYLDRPRVNYDGIYISRTRYIRQGDTGFQDLTYRPFHVVRYYRYLRFFPDKRVLILTSNEEPERIVPIFRHALDAKQFSSELSILEGTYEFLESNQIVILAEKDFRLAISQAQTRRQFHWSRQTPLAQEFNMRFEVKTLDTRPFRNNILKWLDYTILTRLETGQEVTSFDLSPDTFPNLQFYRVKRFNIRTTGPLAGNCRTLF